MLPFRIRRHLHPYRPESYWGDAGRIHVTDMVQEHRTLLLRRLERLEFKTVFEIGVGEADIARELLTRNIIERYDSCDLTPTRQTVARRLTKHYPQFATVLGSFQTVPVQLRYDLMLATECLMHIRPREIRAVMQKMTGHANKYCVNMDYWERDPVSLGTQTFLHDYEALYGQFGWSATRIPLPHRQAIFVAVPSQNTL